MQQHYACVQLDLWPPTPQSLLFSCVATPASTLHPPHAQAWALEGDTLSRLSACTLLEDLAIRFDKTAEPDGDLDTAHVLHGLPELTASCKKLRQLSLSAATAGEPSLDLAQRPMQDYCGRCRIRTKDFCHMNLVRIQ